MNEISLMQKSRVFLHYVLPALIACFVIVKLYHDRVSAIGETIKIQCGQKNEKGQCVSLIQDISLPSLEKEDGIEDNFKKEKQICQYRYAFAQSLGHQAEGLVSCVKEEQKTSGVETQSVDAEQKNTQESNIASKNVEALTTLVTKLSKDVDRKLRDIFLYNSITVLVMALLPYLLMGSLLAKSKRISLNLDQRIDAAQSNGWLKFILGLIMSIGWLYIINPLGRGASTYYQFAIAAGLNSEDTIPIYIQTEIMVPVLAGFFGWYLHLTGYIFTKLVHHDVISARVYNMLFKKFIIVYGIALVLPESGLIESEQNAAFFMFIIGLFPLSAMSVLIEAASKIGTKHQTPVGTLSLLPGISRWQILRLEEEGVDSMASLANIESKTVSENLQFIRRMVFYWRDIAQLYTIVGHDAFMKIKGHCFTASEFVKRSEEENFREEINSIEGVGQAREIARLIEATFYGDAVEVNV